MSKFQWFNFCVNWSTWVKIFHCSFSLPPNLKTCLNNLFHFYPLILSVLKRIRVELSFSAMDLGKLDGLNANHSLLQHPVKCLCFTAMAFCLPGLAVWEKIKSASFIHLDFPVSSTCIAAVHGKSISFRSRRLLTDSTFRNLIERGGGNRSILNITQ